MQKTIGTSVAIVGAGASGLTAAWLLKQAGYDRVTVFEKEGRAGGKCRSVRIDDRSYELGAILHMHRFGPVGSMVREFGIRTMNGTVTPPPARFRSRAFFDLKRNRSIRFPGGPQVLPAALRYTLLAARRPEVCRPGHADMPTDLAQPLRHWLVANGLAALEPMFASWLCGFGYGYADGIPAAYALKFCTPGMIWKSLILKWLRGFVDGYQVVWDRVAASLDVRFDCAVTRIDRSDGVAIHTDHGVFRFDKVILCCDLRAVASVLDTDEDEQDLVDRIVSHRYCVVVADVDNMPARVAFLHQHFDSATVGSTVCWYQRWEDRNLYNFYALVPEGMGEGDVKARIAGDIERVGGRLNCFVESAIWDYFPRVSSADLEAGFYTRLEARQGTRNTYYAGEIMNFPCVDLLARYSADLVARFF